METVMQTYVASIGGTPIMAFRAEDDDQARAIMEEHNMRSDLHTLVGADGKPLWDGKSDIQVEEASPAQQADWEQSRDQAISDGEIDLDAGDNPDEWEVYLIDVPQSKKAQL
jgi:hypothetical protein